MSLELTLLTVSFLQPSPSNNIPPNNLDSPPPLPSSPPPNSLPPKSKLASKSSDNNNAEVAPPPLPRRNRSEPIGADAPGSAHFVPFNNNALAGRKPKQDERDRCYSLGRKPRNSVMVDNSLYSEVGAPPPPLPPRAPVSNPGSSDSDAANSISKQLSYPLVATCATLVNNYVSNIAVYLFTYVFLIFFFFCAFVWRVCVVVFPPPNANFHFMVQLCANPKIMSFFSFFFASQPEIKMAKKCEYGQRHNYSFAINAK